LASVLAFFKLLVFFRIFRSPCFFTNCHFIQIAERRRANKELDEDDDEDGGVANSANAHSDKSNIRQRK
jgi:hypothetical protein